MKKASEANVDSKAYMQGYEYETLMNALHVSVFKCLMNAEFTAIWCNDYFIESTGYTREEYASIYHYSIRDYFAPFLPDEYSQIMSIVMDAYARGDTGFQCVSRMPHKDGSFIWIKVVGTFTEERHGGIPVLYVVYTDITDVIAQQELRKRLEERSEMLRAALEIAENHLSDPDKMHDCHKKIFLSGKHLLGLINDILDMSRIESGKMAINCDVVSLPELLEDVVTIIQPEFKAKNQHFFVRPRNVMTEYVYTDALRLRQIFFNILSNASKFTPEDGTITFDIEGTGYQDPETLLLRFSISDTGIGMKPDFLEHIFEVFTREQDSRVDKTVGSGLGMAITKKIVDMLGGDIEVHSQIGAGTVFRVTLPLKLAAVPQDDVDFQGYHILIDGDCVSISDKKEFDFTGKRFLLAEDNELNLEIAVELLSSTGAEIDGVCDGKQCVERFSQSPERYYDLIFMDIQMPVMDGYTATKTIRKLARKDAETVPIWAMTANAFVEDVEAAIAAGMDGHFSKPLELRLICSEISSFLK